MNASGTNLRSGGKVSVSSTTASPGSTVQVSGVPGDTVYVYVPGSGNTPTSITLNKNGKATLKIPDEGETAIVITDLNWPYPSWVRVNIVNPLGPFSHK